jgi:16S rRNA (cytosine967-C5)-methyltransferase
VAQSNSPSNDKYAVSPARKVAVEVLVRVLGSDAHVFAQDLLEIHAADMDDRDRRFCMDMTYGVIRRRAALDAVIGAYSSRPVSDIDPTVLNILRAGVYQLLYQDRVPQHAAVDESVVLSRALNRHKTSGFVNAILRSITRGLTIMDRPAGGEPTAMLIISPERTCLFNKDIFPPASDEIASLAVRYSYPQWLVIRWAEHYGFDRAEELCDICNRPAPLFIRPNSLKNLPGVLIDQLQAEGVEAQLSPTVRTLRLPAHTRLPDLKAFAEGRFLVQDDSSSAVAKHLDPQPGDNVLDLCAAPGGKTCHMAELMGDQGKITAVDVRAERLKRVTENAARLGLNIIETEAADGVLFAEAHPDAYDRILLDAPCSNTGVLRRRIEARWHLSDKVIAELALLQHRLLFAALGALKPGGTLVYSTCSLEPEENRQCVRDVLAKIEGYRLDAEDQALPSDNGGDGIYMARIIRAEKAEETEETEQAEEDA